VLDLESTKFTGMLINMWSCAEFAVLLELLPFDSTCVVRSLKSIWAGVYNFTGLLASILSLSSAVKKSEDVMIGKIVCRFYTPTS
jgi:hypothetical protein